jgi:PPIC-type PPIASE domain
MAILTRMADFLAQAQRFSVMADITAGHLEQLVVKFARTWQRPPTPHELDGLIDDYIGEEVYYREALAMGLDRDDIIVRRRLRQKLEFIIEDIADVALPSDAELQAFLQQHPDAFRHEPRVSFQHIYLNQQRRGDATAEDARKLLAQLTTDDPTINPGELGDPFLLPHAFELSPKDEIARLVGEAFARQLLQLEPGRWAGPLASAYGQHLVLVRERTDERIPGLEEVREIVAREWLAARRKDMQEAAYRRLRERYTVIVERPTTDGAPAPTQAAVTP